MGSSCDGTLDTQTGTIRVEAPEGMCWSGAMGDRTEDGCGSKDVTIEGEAIIVANAQKMTEGDWPLTLSLEIDGEVVDTSTTTAEFGIATVQESP